MKTLTPAAVDLLDRLCGAGDPCTWSIRTEHDGYHGSSLRLEKSAPLDRAAFDELHRAGFLSDIPNGSGWIVSDAGRKAFLRSTDEMGDGKVYAP